MTLSKELITQYYNQGLSLRKISSLVGVPLATLYVFMAKNKIPMRDKSKAQKQYLSENDHPMLGKEHSDETKQKISKSLEGFWDGLSDQEKEAYKEKMGAAWKNKWASLSKKEKANIIEMLSAKSKETKGSSKFEKFLAQAFKDAGFIVEEKTANYTPGQQFEVDIALPQVGIMIEVDGPTHFKPIYGEEALKLQQGRDNRKNDILLGARLQVLRIRDDNGPLSAVRVRKILKMVQDIKVSSDRKVWYI